MEKSFLNLRDKEWKEGIMTRQRISVVFEWFDFIFNQFRLYHF